MMVKVFAARSVVLGVAAGALVAALSWLIGGPWGLAILNGMVTGALVLTIPAAWRLGRFRARQPRFRRWHGVWALGYAVVIAPAFFARLFLDELDLSTQVVLSTLILVTGFAGYAFGDIVATLDHLDGD
jgi:hypothetical protein